MEGLEKRLAADLPIEHLASVASFFISRVDVVMDEKIAELALSKGHEASAASALRGQIAIANASMAYACYLDLLKSERWHHLAAEGAQPQRLLWASTGTKNPEYRDTLYVEKLSAAGTVNTMPQKTMDAFREHGQISGVLSDEVEEADAILREADGLGLDLPSATRRLADEALAAFSTSFDNLLRTLEAKRAEIYPAE